MRFVDLLKQRFNRSSSPRSCRRRARRLTVLRLEQLEDRVTPTITLTNAFLVDSHDHAVTAPDKGEQVVIQANWSTQGLPSDASYRVSYSIDGVTLNTNYFNFGAGSSGTLHWFWYLGRWYAAPGTHAVTVTIDPTTYGTTSRSFNFTPISAPDLPQKFITPIGGTPFETWGIGNYVDVDPRSGTFHDYNGGPYTYDGHTGHDIGLANFGSMDAGVPEYAAAAGTVEAVQDGNYDRNTAMATYPPANYVDINHGNGWHTIYYHLRTDTILVHVGDTVVQGQVLGLAGSSGNSTGAHLHFEVQHNGDVVEPEYDPNTYWLDPLPYQGSVSAVLTAGVTSSHTALVNDHSAEEQPVSANVFRQVSGQEFSMWFSGFTRANDAAAFRFYKPDGTRYSSLDRSFTASLSRGGWWYYYFTLPANLDLGTWHVGVEINGTELARTSFQVTSAGAGAAHVTQGSTYAPNGRTTPIDFGTASQGGTPPQLSFTITNLGSATLTVSNLVLPSGFSLVGSFPASIAVGSSATFTLQMATDASGTDAGILSFNTNDPNAPTYSFDVKGVVTGGNTGEVHGQVFHDLNGDGIENGPDTGLAGWTVSLLNPADNSVLATTTTGYNGYYAFYNLAPGSYRVRETLQGGYQQTTVNPADVTVGTTDVLASPIGVGINIPTHFVVSVPANATAGTAFNITVTAENVFGNPVTGYTGTVAFTSTDGIATLPASYTFTATDAGVHMFTGVTLRTAGTRFLVAYDTVQYALDGLALVTINPAAADHLLFPQQPSDTVAGQAISPAVTLEILDEFNNVLTNDNSDTVTLSIGNNPGGGTLSGNLTQIVSGGVATFSDVSIDRAGAGYTLLANGASLTAATSNGFAINPAAADHLIFLQQPTGTAGGQMITPAVMVEVVDQFGNVLINDNTDTVTLTIGNNPSGGTLTGTLTMTVTNGIATFSDLSIDVAGSGYTLHATIGGSLPDIDSDPFNIM
jgi:murein DD-endopeptidase MepM/ murein hydrolase activator NlpD